MLDERLPSLAAAPPPAGRCWSPSSASGTCRRSTRPSATSTATACSPRSAPGCASRSATARCRPGSAAPRSRCCSRSTGTWPGPSSRCATCSPRWPGRPGSAASRWRSSCPPASPPARCTPPTGRDLLRCAGDALRRAKATESEVEVYDPAQDIGRDFGPRLLPELIGALERNRIGRLVPAQGRPGQRRRGRAGGAAALAAPGARRARRGHAAPAGRPGRADPAADPGDAGRGGPPVRLVAGAAASGSASRSTSATADVLDSRLPYELARLISEAGVPPGAIQLELAEDLLLVDPGRTRRALSQFRTLGVRLALDHYGRSAPSLTRLRTMPVQELKLDRSFVASVLQSGAGRGGRPVHGQPGPVARHPDRRRRRGHPRPARPRPVVRGARRAGRGGRRPDVRRTRWPTGSAPRPHPRRPSAPAQPQPIG